MHKTTSAKQIAANRRNAVKSTGPRTPRGRAVSRMNALKHGILSRQVLVRGQVLQEDDKELEALHQRFWDELQPEGPLEEMLLDQIVTAHWRLRRALSAESGEIALSVDGGHRRRNRDPDPVLQWMKWNAYGDPVHAMEHTPVGNAVLVGWLTELRADVEEEGALTEAAIKKLAGRFGGKPNTLLLALEDFRKQKERALGGMDVAREQQKAAALAFLTRRVSTYQSLRERCEEENEYAENARQAAAVLPSAAVLEKIMRYETKLERQMYRAMAQLERVQRMRRGEAIPAPLSVQVSDRG
jgi:hypothetical protein